MNKRLIIFFLLYITNISIVFSDDFNILKTRLNKIKIFYSNIIQKVIDSNGNILQENKSEVWIKKPNQFYWNSLEPDKTILVSNGKILWFYDPCIEHVIINWTKNLIKNSSIISIICDNLIDRNIYSIRKKKDKFFLIPKESGKLENIIIKITEGGIIYEILIEKCYGRSFIYKLNTQEIKSIEKNKFCFIIPKGVTVDDLRN